MTTVILIYLFLINVGTFFLYGLDKRRARRHRWRIPEARLLLCAAVGGSIGALTGMVFFHHKTRHPKFAVGVPAILLVQILLVLLAVRLFT